MADKTATQTTAPYGESNSMHKSRKNCWVCIGRIQLKSIRIRCVSYWKIPIEKWNIETKPLVIRYNYNL